MRMPISGFLYSIFKLYNMFVGAELVHDFKFFILTWVLFDAEKNCEIQFWRFRTKTRLRPFE